MKNKIDHCSGSCCPFDMKICVKILMGYPIAMKHSQGCCQAMGVKKQIQGGGGAIRGDSGGRHKHVTDRLKTKTTDAGEYSEWGNCHGDICRDHMT